MGDARPSRVTTATRNYVEISRTEFHSNWSINMKMTDGNSFVFLLQCDCHRTDDFSNICYKIFRGNTRDAAVFDVVSQIRRWKDGRSLPTGCARRRRRRRRRRMRRRRRRRRRIRRRWRKRRGGGGGGGGEGEEGEGDEEEEERSCQVFNFQSNQTSWTVNSKTVSQFDPQ